MPYEVIKRGDRWAVVKADGTKTFGTHPTRVAALAQLRALYAAEDQGMKDARKGRK